jgi:hypothetical protein
MGPADIQVTAASLRSLQVYGPKAQRSEYDQAVRRPLDWLMKAQPRTTEEPGVQWADHPEMMQRREERRLEAERKQ